MTDDSEWVCITREFESSIERLWDMWTKPELFQAWFGPNGMSIPVAQMDVKVGGKRKIGMQVGERTMWLGGEYKEIDAPNRLVTSEYMCDENGTLMSPQMMGFPQGTPEKTEYIVELSEEDGLTTMVMTHIGVPAGSPGEGGWMQAIDKLAAQL